MNIWIAASDGNLDKVKEFVGQGQTANDKDVNGYTPMHAAVSYGHRDLLDYLISVGGDVNISDEDGDRPLHVVESLDMAKYLVEELKVDYKVKNSEDQIPLQKLEEEDEFPELIEYLRELTPELSNNKDRDDAKEQEGEYGPDEKLPELPASSSVSYSYEREAEGEVNEEQRRKIEQIIHGENPQQGMMEYLREAVQNQVHPEEEEGSSAKKKAKKDI